MLQNQYRRSVLRLRDTIRTGGLPLAATILLMLFNGCRPEEPPDGLSDADPDLKSPISRSLQEPSSTSENDDEIQFQFRGPETGVLCRHVSGISEDRWFPAFLGSGAAFIDVECDGRPDILLATACPLPYPNDISPYQTRLFRNAGRWSFQSTSYDRGTGVSGLGFDGFIAGVAVVDADNDGFSDLCLNGLGGYRLYRNLGDGTFSLWDIGLPTDTGFGSGVVMADFNNDSFADLYVCRYAEWDMHHNKWCGDPVSKVRAFCHPREVEPVSDLYFRSRGDGTFEDVSESSGVSSRKMRALCALAAHLDEDNKLDLYVSNDGMSNSLLLNQGDDHFEDAAERRGCAVDGNGRPQASMGIALADFDRNQLPDLLITNYSGEYNTLYRGLGNGNYIDDSRLAGSAQGSIPFVGWGTSFADLNADGWEDLIVVNGHVDWNMQYLNDETPYRQPIHVYRNDKGRLEQLKNPISPSPEEESSRGLIVGDVDGDLDVDALVTSQDAIPILLENTGRMTYPMLSLLVKGRISNRDGVGTQLVRDGDKSVFRQVYAGGSYLSASSPEILVASDGPPEAAWRVYWPNGQRADYSSMPQHGRYILLEPTDPDEEPTIYAIPK